MSTGAQHCTHKLSRFQTVGLLLFVVVVVVVVAVVLVFVCRMVCTNNVWPSQFLLHHQSIKQLATFFVVSFRVTSKQTNWIFSQLKIPAFGRNRHKQRIVGTVERSSGPFGPFGRIVVVAGRGGCGGAEMTAGHFYVPSDLDGRHRSGCYVCSTTVLTFLGGSAVGSLRSSRCQIQHSSFSIN